MKAQIKLKTSEEYSPKVFRVGNKSLETPFFAQEIRSIDERKLAIVIKRQNNLENSGMLIVSLLDAHRMLSRASESIQRFLGSKKEQKLTGEDMLIVDPSWEYLYHEVGSEQKSFQLLKGIPEELKKIITTGHYSTGMDSLFNGKEKKIVNCVAWSMEQSMDYEATLPLPPSVPIQGMKTLKWALEINRIGQTIAQDNEWVEASFFNIDSRNVFSPEILDVISEYIQLNDANVIVLKHRNGIKPESPQEMAAFYDFSEGLKKMMQEKIVLSLNTDSFGYITLGLHGDGFGEPINGTIFKDFRKKKKKIGHDIEISEPVTHFGKYKNPNDWLWWRHKEMKSLIRNNGKKFPCSCPVCSDVDVAQVLNNETSWNDFRKRHVICFNDERVREHKEDMLNGRVQRALFDKLSSTGMMHSEFSKYRSWFR